MTHNILCYLGWGANSKELNTLIKSFWVISLFELVFSKLNYSFHH